MKFIIPFKTPTINHLYGQYGYRKFLKPEARVLREKIKEIIYKQNDDLVIGGRLSINIKIHENWLNKDRSIKRKDISNREKFLVDSIFEDLNVDDKQIFKHTMQKIQDIKEFAEVEILNSQ